MSLWPTFLTEEFIINDRKKRDDGPRINEEIRVPEVRLISDLGEQFGVVKIGEARRIADEKGLDLVEVSPNSKPPVVKIIDYGKFKYEAQKKANEAKKKQATFQLKEFQFRPNIEKHDLDVKLHKIERVLAEGDKVRLVMQFRGREIAYKDAGLEKFNGIINTTLEMGGLLEAEPKFMGSRIIAIVAPTKKK